MKDKVFTPTVTILVPAHNEGSSIEAAIQSLLEVVYPDLEILVINDGSTDDTLECASRWAGAYRSATVRVIDTGVNVGKAEALNIGLENTTREVVVVMDADSRLEPQSILKGVAHFINPEVVAVAGNVKIINRVNFITKLQTLEYLLGLNLVRRAQGYFQCVNIIPGPMGFFRRDVLLELGGYDSDTYAEDCDLTLKMLARGQRVNYEPDAISWTECPENISGLITQRYRWTRGILQALKKNKTSFFHIKKSGFVNSFMLWYMLFEAIAWPIMNIFGNLFFLFVAGYYGAINLLILWWLILVLLDMTGALHTVTFEEEELSLVFYSIPYRMFFIFGVDITKVLATFEELINVGMSWGSIERRGRTAKK
jgi:cellulose synthase/poly-beta-1,6-N-acetylglucosamine synthase-like glycosyltransferase